MDLKDQSGECSDVLLSTEPVGTNAEQFGTCTYRLFRGGGGGGGGGGGALFAIRVLKI
jgi:hypothetical protein